MNQSFKMKRNTVIYVATKYLYDYKLGIHMFTYTRMHVPPKHVIKSCSALSGIG